MADGKRVTVDYYVVDGEAGFEPDVQGDFDPWIHKSKTRIGNPAYGIPVDHITAEDLKAHVPWTTEKIDHEALLTGSSMLNLMVPRKVEGVSSKGISILLAEAVLVDNAMHAPVWEEWWDRRICGVKIADWIEGIFTPASSAEDSYKQYAMETVRENCMAQISTIWERRRNETKTAEKLVESAVLSVDKFVRWRDREGQFFGVLHLFSIAAGVDLRTVPKNIIWWTVKASVVNYDLHARSRHQSEDEAGSCLNYFGHGNYGDRVTEMLEMVRNTYDIIVASSKVSPDAAALLTRFIMSCNVFNYHCERWMKWSAIHMQPREGQSGKWSHTYLADGIHAPKYTELAQSAFEGKP